MPRLPFDSIRSSRSRRKNKLYADSGRRGLSFGLFQVHFFSRFGADAGTGLDVGRDLEEAAAAFEVFCFLIDDMMMVPMAWIDSEEENEGKLVMYVI